MLYKILFVDDDVDMREAMKRYLTGEGFAVIVAGDGNEGIEAASKENPSLIITDARMPSLNGVEMTRQLRADPRFRELPIIILTGFGSALRVQAEQAGADEVLIKPVGPDFLVTRINFLLAPEILPAPATH